MGCTLFYDKQFIKVNKEGKEEYIPMMLVGSTNDYIYDPVTDREVRARFWMVLTYYTDGNKFHASKEDILNVLEGNMERLLRDCAERAKEENEDVEAKIADIKERYGYYAMLAINGSPSSLSYKKYLGFFKGGISRARTFKEMKEIGAPLQIVYEYRGDNVKDNPVPESKEITSDEEYFKEMEKVAEWRSRGRDYQADLEFCTRDWKRVHYEIKFTRRKEARERKIKKLQKEGKIGNDWSTGRPWSTT